MHPAKKLVGSEEERAVSPVIGVILMVAITVILAAVIAAFVLDIGPGGEAVSGGVDISEDGSTISVTDGGNADGVVVADDTGSVVWGQEANTGAEYDSLSVNGTVYLTQNESSLVGGPLDSADGQTNVGQIE